MLTFKNKDLYYDIFINSYYMLLHESHKFIKKNESEGPGGFDHKDAMGSAFGFMIALVFSVILGIILEVFFWKVIL